MARKLAGRLLTATAAVLLATSARTSSVRYCGSGHMMCSLHFCQSRLTLPA
jgi:hypothetical protein